jgi:LysR family transcriptional regulator, cell division regulator
MTQVEINWQERLVIGATQTISALKVPKILSSFLRLIIKLMLK